MITARPSGLGLGAHDFAPGLLAIQDSPPPKMPRVVLRSIAALFAVLLLWACVGRLDIIASAEGRLVPKSYVKIVQPAQAGIVQEILVGEGEKVVAGQVLMRMDTHDARADEKVLRGEFALKALQLRRIDAELRGTSFTLSKDDPPALGAQVLGQWRDHRQAYEDAMKQAEQAQAKTQTDLRAGMEQLRKLDEVTPLLKDQAKAYADMGKDGYVPQMTVVDKQREYLEKSRDREAQLQTVASLQAASVQARSQLDQVTSKYRSDLQSERIEAQAAYSKLEQDLSKQVHQSDLLELKAPQAGIVKDLATHTLGTVVSPGSILLTLVPENEPLLAEVRVKNDDVGFVHAGQPVKLKLAAYTFQHYGMLDGRVLRIDPDASDGDRARGTDASRPSGTETQAPSSYKALVVLKSQALEGPAGRFDLVPGMQLVAEINEGNRTVMQYLLSPLSKTVQEGGRER